MRPEIQGSDTLQNILIRDRILAEEIKLTEEVVEALYERDIMLLRDQLKKTAGETVASPGAEARFELSEELTGPFNVHIDDQELEIGNYLQKLHLNNHKRASKEVVHDMFSTLDENIEIDDLVMSPDDELLFNEMRDAVTENDVNDLRANIRSIAQGVSLSQCFVQIDDLAGDEFGDELDKLFREDAIIQSALASERMLQDEISIALAEKDIMNLRSNLQTIARDGAEHETHETKVVKMASPRSKMVYWSAAASIVVLFAISALFQPRGMTDQELYASYYQPYKSGENVSRSASTASANVMSAALREMDRGDYATALNMLKIASADKQFGFAASFYAGEAYQALGDYKNAIKSFAEVVQHGDNLLVEQSEWFIGLCYLNMNEKARAVSQFSSIASSHGFYSEKSNELLKQLR